MTKGDFAKLGEMIKARRRELGLSYDAIAKQDGPSRQTVKAMEEGEPRRRRLDTTFPLEQILGWSPGSIDGYLDYGTKPHVVRDPQPAGVVDLTTVPLSQLRQEIARREKR